MRLALALLLATFAAAPVAAQQARPSQPAPSSPPSQSGQSGQANPFNQVAPSGKPSQSEEVLRQRILLREKFNKGWDVQNEDPREKRARCKSEARKRYTVIHQLKRRKFIKDCIARKA